MYNLVKEHATHFSEQIRMQSHHLESVKVAGEIKKIIPPLLEDQTQLPGFYTVELDDSVGDMMILLSPEHFSAKNYETGMMVSFTGYINVLVRDFDSNVKKDFSIAAYDSYQIKEDKHEKYNSLA